MGFCFSLMNLVHLLHRPYLFPFFLRSNVTGVPSRRESPSNFLHWEHGFPWNSQTSKIKEPGEVSQMRGESTNVEPLETRDKSASELSTAEGMNTLF